MSARPASSKGAQSCVGKARRRVPSSRSKKNTRSNRGKNDARNIAGRTAACSDNLRRKVLAAASTPVGEGTQVLGCAMTEATADLAKTQLQLEPWLVAGTAAGLVKAGGKRRGGLVGPHSQHAVSQQTIGERRSPPKSVHRSL